MTIRTALLALATCFWAALATAQTAFPALFDVSGVAGDDVLNLRAAPDGSAPVIGSLAPTARAVEVVDTNAAGTWGLINVGERSGWASLRYLVRQPGQQDRRFPTPLSCYGTEPFWSLDLSETGADFNLPAESKLSFDVGDRRRSANRTDRWAFITERPGAEAFGVIYRGLCGDGMSDRDYGLTLDLLIGDVDSLRLYSGCCTLAVD